MLSAALGASLLLTGCSAGPIRVDVPPLAVADEPACRAMLDDLPDQLAEEDRRDAEPDGVLGAAFGDPAIVVTCTDVAPEAFDQFASCDQVNDVGWFVPREQVADDDADVELWAMSHRPIVRLTIPAEYRPDGAAAALAELSDPISANLQLEEECL